MLGQLEALRLVVGADALAVERVGARQHLLVDEAADDLAVLEDERHLARAHFEDGAGAAAAGAGIAEAGIEEAGIVDAEFADQRIERHHLRGAVRRHLHGLARGEDVELVGIEDQALVAPRLDRLPELGDVVARAAVDVDQAGVALGAVADEAVVAEAGEIDADRHAVGEVGRGCVDEALALMQRCERGAADHRVAMVEPDLREARALAHQHRKGPRADLGIERPVIAGLMRSKPRVASAITRVNTSRRPVELFGLAAPPMSGGSARLSSSGTM